MEIPELKRVICIIEDFLTDHNIEYKLRSAEVEREWTDFRLNIKDPAQMLRINTWLKDDFKDEITGYTNIDISAPNPTSGKEIELRIRIYGQN